MVRLDIVSWRDGAKIIGAIGQKYIDVNTLDPSQGAPRAPAGTTGPRTGLLPLQRPGAATRPLRALKAGKP